MQENKLLYDDLGLKCACQTFFWSKDVNFCPQILVFFREKISGRFGHDLSGHDFVQTAILNTVVCNHSSSQRRIQNPVKHLRWSFLQR